MMKLLLTSVSKLPSKAGLNKQHPLFSTWWSMHLRCRYPRTNKFEYYGGKGIQVCDRWDSFQHFCEDMGSRPDKHQLDRVDSDGHYEPQNCRWYPAARNRSRT